MGRSAASTTHRPYFIKSRTTNRVSVSSGSVYSSRPNHMTSFSTYTSSSSRHDGWRWSLHMTDLIDFALTTRAEVDGSVLIAVAGELDLHRLPALADALQAAAAPVVVDLQEVTFLDSATLALLVREHRRLEAEGHELTVVVGRQTPTTVFAVTGIDRILTIESAEQPPPAADGVQAA